MTAPDRVLHPRRGTHDPTTATPPRRPGSVRRTASTTMVRPFGLAGPLLLAGRVRDVTTDRNGGVVVSGEASVDATVDFLDYMRLVDIATEPGDERVRELIGTPATTGFRARIVEVLADHAEARSGLHLLLDDIPVATLVSGFAMQQAGTFDDPAVRKDRRRNLPMLQQADMCAGWRTGGSIMDTIEASGEAPVVTGPEAPPIDTPDDPYGWHEMDALVAHAMRRQRRLDLIPGAGPHEPWAVDATFRDSHRSADGLETIVHEYRVLGRLDPESLVFLDAEAIAHALPWQECPEAVPSAARLAGMDARTLRATVRSDFVGTTTCTHLNDLLRSLEDVVALVPLLA